VDGQAEVQALVNATFRYHIFFLRTSYLSLHYIQVVYHVSPVRLLDYFVAVLSEWLLSLYSTTVLAIYLTDRTATAYRHYHSRVVPSRFNLELRQRTNKRHDH
jgi:hypothetical protein